MRFLSRQEQSQKILREEAARCWRIAHTKDDTLPSDFATTLDELMSQLQPLRDERSLASLEDLLDAYRALADNDPGTHKPRLAWALIKSIHAFPQEKVLPAAEEAAAAYRELADADAITFLPYFATAVHDEASRLARLGRVDDAEKLMRDLADSCRRLTPSDTAIVLPILASSLSHLGNWLWESMPGDSLAAREEATAIYRELTSKDPARYLSYLISSLRVLASSFSEMQRQDEELTAIRVALDAYRTHDINAMLISTEKPEDALYTQENAPTLLGQLAQSRPTAFSLALRLWKLGHQQEALEAGHVLYPPPGPNRRLAALSIADNRPIRFMTRLWEERNTWLAGQQARFWRGIVWLLDKDTWSSHAWRRLNYAQHRLAAYLQRLSDALDTVSFRRQIIGQNTDACAAAANAVRAQDAAVGIYREMYDPLWLGSRPYLAIALDTLARRLQAAGEGESARSVASEAGEALRKWQAYQAMKNRSGTTSWPDPEPDS